LAEAKLCSSIKLQVVGGRAGGRMPRPGLQRKRAAAALSQAGRAGPDQPIRAMQPAGRTRRPPTGCTRQTSNRQTSDVRQYHRLMPPGRGHNKLGVVRDFW